MKKFLLSGLSVLVALTLISCGEADEAQRVYKGSVSYSTAVDAGIRVNIDAGFDSTKHCIQWFEGFVEFFNIACPANNKAIEAGKKVASFPYKSEGADNYVIHAEGDSKKTLGRFNKTQLTELCGTVPGKVHGCTIGLKNSLLDSIKLK